MSVFTLKRVGLATVAVVSVGGIIKASVDASSPSVVPLADASELSFTPPSPTRFISEEANEVKSRKRRETEVSFEEHQIDYPKKVNEAEEKRREEVRTQASDILDRLNDYTFKLFTPCGAGTAWVLDYVLPQGVSQRYPLTWYFATNLHVISSFRFQNNPYSQTLPRPEEETRRLKNENRWIKHSHLNLSSSSTCKSVDRYGYLDISLSQASWGAKERADHGLAETGKIKIPKLFWAAYNFLEKDEALGINDHHFSDFAVLEIEFENERLARKYTNSFADKYGEGRGKKTPIDVFGAPLESRYSKEKLYNLNENFYLLAYPHKDRDRWSSTHNFSRDIAVASQLTGSGWNPFNDPEKKKYRGFVDAKKVMKKKVMWDAKPLWEIGHFYKLKNNPLGLGSSGGFFVDGTGTAIGVTAVTTLGGSGPSWIAPLRSIGVKADEAETNTPSYDLILGGGERQLSSYKSQLEKFVLRDGRKTWLSTRRGWDTNWRLKAKNQA